jgi:hypothetical protein
VNVAETLLVFVGVPLAIVLVMAALIFLPGGSHRRARYRPGQPWAHDAIWYEPHPEQSAAGHGDGHGDGHSDGHGAGHGAAALTGAVHQALPAGHGAATPAAPARKAGPLGGARGTW